MDLKVGVAGVVEIPTLFEVNETNEIRRSVAEVEINVKFEVDLSHLANELEIPLADLTHERLIRVAEEHPALLWRFSKSFSDSMSINIR